MSSAGGDLVGLTIATEEGKELIAAETRVK